MKIESCVKKLAFGGGGVLSVIRPIEEIRAEVEGICGGKPQKPRLTDKPVAVIKWVDGTLLDTAWQVVG